MNELFSAVIPFLKEAQEQLVAMQERLPQGQHQNPPLEVVEVPSTFTGRLQVDHRLVIPANTHLRDIVTSVQTATAFSVAPSSEGVTVLPQTRPVGGPSEAATYMGGQNRAVEQAGPSGQQWWTKSPSNLNSSDWRSLAQCFESPPEPGDEASSLPPAQEALPQPPTLVPQPPVQHVPLEQEATSSEDARLYRAVSAINDACEHEEKVITQKTRALLAQRGIAIEDPKDVKRAVEVAMTEEWEVDIDDRLSHFRKRRRYFGTKKCPLWPDILDQLRDLGNPDVPEE